MLDILRDKFQHDQIPAYNRVLYIVPLTAIVSTLKLELEKFKVDYEVLDADHKGALKKEAKVTIVTPEKLVNKLTLKNITELSWSAVVLDEPHYLIMWGTSKKKKGVIKKPFREAFQQLNRLNVLGAPFEMHTATAPAKDLDKIFALLGRKDSLWLKQIEVPERPNLTYYLIDGRNVSDIKQFPFVLKHLEEDAHGALLIYVHKLEEGSRVFCSLMEYANENGLITWSSRSAKAVRPVAF